MTEPVEPPLPSTPPPNAEQLEFLKFLREEAEANRKAQRDESDSNRKLFLDMSRIVAIPIAVFVALAGIFFYHDMTSMKDDMKSQGEAAARAEIQKMDTHIDDTLQAQFKTETIQNTIQQAAEKATREEAPDLIREVITPEVKRAVASQSGTIKEVATRAATDEVKSAIDPIVGDVKLQAVIARANADDARAFDELLVTRDKGSPSQKDLVNGVIVNLQRHAPEGTAADRTSYYYECTNPSGTAYQALLTSPLVSVRKDAIADCIAFTSMGQWAPKLPGDTVSAFAVIENIAPMWIKVAFNDPSLSVRAEAIYGINMLFKGGYAAPNNGFDLLDTYFLREWWTKNSSNQAGIALVAFAGGGNPGQQVDARLDQIGLYDEAQRLAKTSNWGAELDLLRERMRLRASLTTYSPAAIAKEMGRSCADAEKDLEIRMQGFRKRLEDERVDGYGLLELRYLHMSCSVQEEAVSQIAEYGAITRSMTTRYFAVEIVNKSSGVSLDPYESKPLQDWLKGHSGSTSH